MLKVDKMKLAEQQDRRVKLLKEDKEEIYHLYNNVGGYSLNDLAKKYKVSKKTILLIVNKNSKEKNDLNIKNNWSKYYNKDSHREVMKNTRNYKKQLLENGEL